MPIRMLALDLDGTLAVGDHDVLPATRRELVKLHHSGVEVVIATGRRYRTTRFVIDNLGLDVYAICNGGALVKAPDGSTLHARTIPAQDINSLVGIARSMNLALFCQRDSHETGGPDFIIDDAVDWCPLTEKYYRENRQWSGREDLLNCDSAFMVTGTMGEKGQLETFAERIELHSPGRFNNMIVPHIGGQHYYCEITLAEVTKWYGLSRLADLFGIDATSICAVGDQINDLPMLKAVSHGVVMGNGIRELHEYARFVCGAHDADGLLDVIDYIRTHNDEAAV